MINLPVDEAFALDFLAILIVKMNRLKRVVDSNNYYSTFESLSNSIKNFIEVVSSKEFADLYDANALIFDTIEEIRAGKEMSAVDLDAINNKRFAAKLAIQKKFFNSPITESKTHAR